MLKEYSVNILEKTSLDYKVVELNKDREKDYKEYIKFAVEELETIKKLLSKLSIDKDEDIFDTLYRKNHILYGLAEIMEIPRVAHILSITDFIFDYGRKEQTLSNHSMTYLINLMINILLNNVFNDILTMKVTYDISFLIDECRTYLKKALIEFSEKPNEQKMILEEPETDEVKESYKETKPDLDKETSPFEAEIYTKDKKADTSNLSENIPYDDEPEILEIPQDKLGFISDFYEESSEMLNSIGNQLIELETSTGDSNIVNDLFRKMHTVKGGARLLNIKKMEFLAHRLENLLQKIREGSIKVVAEIIDILLEGKQVLGEILEEVASRGPIRTRIKPVMKKLTDFLNTGTTDNTMKKVERQPEKETKDEEKEENKIPEKKESLKSFVKDKTSESIRVNTEKLDEVLNTASEIFVSRIKFQGEINAIKNLVTSFKQILSRTTQFTPDNILKRVNDVSENFVNDLKYHLIKTSGEVKSDFIKDLLERTYKKAIGNDINNELSIEEEITLNYISLDDIRKKLQKNLEIFEQLSSRLQNKAMGFRMVPISSLFNRFPTQVREMARNLRKKVKLEVVGGDTELDKVLINKLADPMVHMLRNSVDHGIEKPEERINKGKPEFGIIRLKTYYYGSHAIIEIQDDGKGINADKVFNKSVEKGLVDISKRDKLTEAEIFDFLFMPGFSTSDKISELSGRGVGMDVVKTSIQQLHGTIEINSELDKGTTIKLKLPLTLAIVRILLVKEGTYQFAFPLLNVLEIITIKREELNFIENRIVYNLRGKTIPVSTLSSILDFEVNMSSNDLLQMVILSENNKTLGIVVSEIMGRQEILIKNLGKLLKKVPYIMGCTILKDSKLVLILDPREIVTTYQDTNINIKLSSDDSSKNKKSLIKQNILIIDDSSIQRDHLKNMLTKYGYVVDTAENGFEALKISKTKIYSAFCVDIVMPLMDGYEFVERLRKIELYKQTPVFLITGKGESVLDNQLALNLNITKRFHKPVDEDIFIDVLKNSIKETVGGNS
jgi:two-component system chemotaxis sensor kinase CheA